MGFYLRKSVKAGPFRFNLSRSGLGVSAGVKGMRIGTGPRGTYVHMGRGGLYYRQTLSGGSNRRRTGPLATPLAPSFSPSPELVEALPTVTVLETDFGTPTDLVEDLNAAARRFPLWPVTWMKGLHRVPVMYDINDAPAQAFDTLVSAFQGVQSSLGRWLIDAQGALTTTYQRKVNAGASSLVDRQAAASVVDGPKWLVTNIVVPGLRTKRFSVYFLPDQILVQIAKRFAAWRYSDLAVSLKPTRFVEEQAVPRDARQVDQTWKFVNKDGGPDKRFNNNRILPVMEYGELNITGAGLTLRWQLSNVPAARAFADRLASTPTVPLERAAFGTTSSAPLLGQPSSGSATGPMSSSAPPQSCPPGWYPDPMHSATWRWWDGHSWTDHTG